MRPTLAIIIVNWNSGDQLCECIKSIKKTSKKCYEISEVVIIDNASEDLSTNGIEELVDKAFPVKKILNLTNMGFAKACNQGAQVCSADYILFLNPDVSLSNTALDIPIGFLERPEAQGYALAGIKLLNRNGTVQRTCARIPTAIAFAVYSLGLDRLIPSLFKSHIMNEWPHDQSRDIEHCIGAFYLLRSKVFYELGTFDERFFVYLEDLDFSKRLNEAGFLARFLANTWSFHRGGGSSEAIKSKRLYYSLCSRLKYLCKHYAIHFSIPLFFMVVSVEPIVRIAFSFSRGSFSQVNEIIRAYWMLWINLPHIIRSR